MHLIHQHQMQIQASGKSQIQIHKISLFKQKGTFPLQYLLSIVIATPKIIATTVSVVVSTAATGVDEMR